MKLVLWVLNNLKSRMNEKSKIYLIKQFEIKKIIKLVIRIIKIR
jgi:hypothetical protein